MRLSRVILMPPVSAALPSRVLREGATAAWMRLLLMLLVTVVAAIFAMTPGPAHACGDVGDWIRVYEDGDRHRALFHLLDCAADYQPPHDDALLLPVVSDALERGGEVAKLGMAAFRHFNHLYGAHKLSGYQEVLAEVKARDGKVPLDRYRRWLVVIARSGAWLRAGPGAGSKGLAALPRGLTVRGLERRGEWVRVRPVGPGSVDPHFQGKAGFVHGSLLAPY